jgi:excinuclease UvrABC nuclease subunit
MDLRDKAAQLPLSPGVYLYKDAAGRVIYVGKAKSLRARVRSYFSDDRLAEAKTGTLISEAATSITSWSTTKKKRWRSKTTSSSSGSRASTSCCATTKPIPTSS